MQIGTLQDEEDEGAAPSSQEEPSEPPFLQSALGTSPYTDERTNTHVVVIEDVSPAHWCSVFIVPIIPTCVVFTALSKPHLFEGRGHNRQGSDSSVDRFVPKDEPAEPEPDNKVKTSIPALHSGREGKGKWMINVSDCSTSLSASQPSRIKGPIGHYTDRGAEPLVHCVRLLAASFLLTGQKKGKI